MNLGLSNLALPAFRRGGAAPFDGMLLGLGLGGTTNYSGYKPFVDVCRQMNVWERTSGTATFTQSQGELTPSDSTSEFRSYVSTMDGLPEGTYTVLNPNGCNINLNAPYGSGYTTATEWTFYLDPALGSYLELHAKGPVSGVQIIMPGRLAAYQAGDIFNPEWIAYQEGLSPSAPLRFMDWAGGAQNIEQEWTDRNVTSKMSFYAPGGGFTVVPWEIIIEVCNRLNRDAWINVPHRASQDYVDQLAALFAAELNPGLKVYVETSNEVWNFASAYHMSSQWFWHGEYTRNTATHSGGVFTKTAHGLSNDNRLWLFVTHESARAGIGSSLYPYGSGTGTYYVEVLTANTFKLWTGAGATGTQLTFTPGGAQNPFTMEPPSFIYLNKDEPGKVDETINLSFANTSYRNWLAFDAALGQSRVKAVMSTQAAGNAYTEGRLDPDFTPDLSPLIPARCDYIAGAPYFYGCFFGGQVDVASGQFTPKAWTNAGQQSPGPMTIHFGVYASGSTPRAQEVVDGVGTGFINKTSFTHTSMDAEDTYKSGTAITGLSNGTSYACHMVFVEPTTARTWMISQTIQASATTSTVNFHDTYENMKLRNILAMAEYSFLQVDAMNAIVAACPNTNIRVANYEGGMHLDETNSYVADRCPEPLRTWMIDYTSSPEFASALDHYYKGLAARNVAVHCIFVDMNTGSLSWTLADNILDVTDARYTGAASYSGRVTKRTRVDLESPQLGSELTTDPGTFPVSVLTLPAAYTYTIVDGNGYGNYALAGNVLQMVADNSVDWGAPTTNTLTVLATDGHTDDVFTVQTVTGDAWYAIDSAFAWDPAIDTDTTKLNPVIGTELDLISGTGAVYETDRWAMNNTSYAKAGNQGLASTMDYGNPVLLAVTVQRNTLYDSIGQFHNNPFFIRVNANAFVGFNEFRWTIFVTGGVSPSMTWTNPDNFNVMWFYYDPATNTATIGQNQTTGTTTSPLSESLAGLTANMHFELYDRPCKLGKIMAVSRSGMTLANAKALVQKMQDAQGIT